MSDKIGNCNDTNCKYFDILFELNCSYSDDNSICFKKQNNIIDWQAEAEKWGNEYNLLKNELMNCEMNLSAMTALAEKYKGRKCNNCKNYRREGNTTIRGCEYKPDRKSPKRWFCADWKSIQEAYK